MTRMRWNIVIVVVVCLGLLGICLIATFVPQPGVTKQNFDWIQVGKTTRVEVEELFGKRPDDNSIDNADLKQMTSGPDTVYVWRGKNCKAVITINKEGKVTGTSWMLSL